MNKNLIILTLSQIFSFTAAPVTVFLSGIIGSQISPLKSLSTLPMSISVVGIAIGAIFATKVMSLIGRKAGFISASIGNSVTSLIAAFAILQQSFYLFCFANFFIGVGMAFTHQYRFAAAESVEKDKVPKAISIILLGGIVSAFLGPGIANYAKDIVSENLYVGSYLALSILTIFPVIFFMFYENTSKVVSNVTNSGRSYFELISQPRFLQAIVAAAFGYAIMTFLMTATPLSMHVMDNMSLSKTSIVIQFHVIGMFLPSLFSGDLVKKFGNTNIIYSGVIILFMSIIINTSFDFYYSYLVGLILLGIGWNFLFVSGSSLLVVSYEEKDKFTAQGLNDFIVFSTQGIGALSAGFLLYYSNWKILNLLCIPLLIIVAFISFRASKKSI